MAVEPTSLADPDRPVLPTESQRRALRLLESVYKKATLFDGGKSLKGWIRPDEGSPEHRAARDYVLQEVLHEWIRAGERPAERVSEVGDRRAFYRRQTELAVPLIATSAREWMRGRLDIEQAKLSNVMIDALSDSKGAHTAAVEVVEDAKKRVVSVRDPESWAVMYPANRSWPRDGDTIARMKKLQYIAIVRDRLVQLTTPAAELGRSTDRRITRVEGFQLTDVATRGTTAPRETIDRPTWLIEGYQLLQRLLWHPRGAEFVNAFERSGLSGTQHATAAVRDSLKACATARSTIDDDLRRVWRISPAVVAGVAKLGSRDPVSLTNYALVWAATEKTLLEKGIAFLSDVIAAIGLFGGLAGELVEAVADAILSGTSTAVSFLKQQEQEQAFLATAFEKQSERLSSGGRYASAVIEGAAALVAAVALPGAVQSVTRRAAKTTGKVGKQPTRASLSTSPTKSKDIARGLDTSDAGQKATRGTQMTGKAAQDVFETATSRRRPAPDFGAAASQGTGSKGSPATGSKATGASSTGPTGSTSTGSTGTGSTGTGSTGAGSLGRPGRSNLPPWELSERYVSEYLKATFPHAKWVDQPLLLKGAPAKKHRGKNPHLSTEPDSYSPDLQVAAESKRYEQGHPRRGYVALIENRAGSASKPGQMVQRAFSMPAGSHHWLFIDVRGQNVGDLSEFQQSLRRDLNWRNGNIFEKVHFITDNGVVGFNW